MAKSEAEKIEETLALLSTAQEFDTDQLKNLVLFVGITGSGKSTICQFLAENPNLISQRDGVAGDFSISDGDEKISESTAVSKTLFPEILTIPNSDVTLADCPGFADTRSPQHDIAATVFIKQLLNKAENVKIVIVTSHHAVRKGVDRTAFTDLLRHVSNFIKDIEKFKDSIALVVTKVENQYYEDDDGNDQLVNDNMMIDQIKTFLKFAKVTLESYTSDNDTVGQRLLLDILSEENNSKIGIFRRPTKVGPLNANKRLVEEKNAIKQLMNQQMVSIQTQPDDFGLTLSEGSQLMVTKLQQSIENNQSDILNKYLADLQSMLKLKTDEATNIEDVKWILNTLNQLIEFCENENEPNWSITEFLQETQHLATQNSTQLLDEWQVQSKFAYFLESIVGKRDGPEQVNDFNRFTHRLNSFRETLFEIKKMNSDKAENLMDELISNVIMDIMADVSSHMENLKITPYSNLAKCAEEIYEIIEKFSQNSAEIHTFQDFVAKFKSILRNLYGFIVNPRQSQQIQSFQAEIANIKVTAGPSFFDGHHDKWFQAIKSSLMNLNSIVEWHNFISILDTELSAYENQQNLESYHENIKNWNEFKVFAQKLGQTPNLTKQLRTRSALDAKQQKTFDSLIDFATSQSTYFCEASKLIVTGNFIKISQVIAEYIPHCASFKELYLFAAQTVFIDATLNAASKNVYLIAPTWHILSNTTINLKGHDGEPTTSVLSVKPGGPGGNFVGVGDKFINGQKLTVDVSGGQGAPGIDGADGANGYDGKTYGLEEIQNGNWNCGRHSFFGTINVPDSHRSEGSNGQPGSDGKDGSRPGFGGSSGRVAIKIISYEPLQMKLIQNEGKRGLVGKGGKGGTGGYNGKDHIFRCEIKVVHDNWFSFHAEGKFSTINLVDNGKAPDGQNGLDGVAGSPERSSDPEVYQPLPIVAGEYKRHFEGLPLLFGKTRSFIESHYFSNSIDRSKRSVPQTLPLLLADKGFASSKLLTVGYQQPNGETTLPFSCANISLSSIVQLVDFVIRKFKKNIPPTVKYSSETATDWDRLLVQAEVLQIVEKCEQEYNEQNENNPKVGHFDPLPLLKKLKQMRA
jgi:hypothetical protein